MLTIDHGSKTYRFAVTRGNVQLSKKTLLEYNTPHFHEDLSQAITALQTLCESLSPSTNPSKKSPQPTV